MSDLNLWPIDPITDEEYAARTDAGAPRPTEGFDAIIAYSTAKITANVRYLTSYYTRFAGPSAHARARLLHVRRRAPRSCPLTASRCCAPTHCGTSCGPARCPSTRDVAGSTSLGPGPRRGDRRARPASASASTTGFCSPPRTTSPSRRPRRTPSSSPRSRCSYVRAVKSPAELERHPARREDRRGGRRTPAWTPSPRGSPSTRSAWPPRRRCGASATSRRPAARSSRPARIAPAGSSLPTREKTIQRGEWVLFDVLPQVRRLRGRHRAHAARRRPRAT